MRTVPAVLAPLLLLVPLWAILPPASAAEAVEWHDYEEGIDLSAGQNLTVLMDFSTSWCSWCKKMDEDTYSDSRVIAKSLFFVCIRVDGDARPDLVSRYGVEGYPTTVFLGPNGNERYRTVGYKGPDDFLKDMSVGLGDTPPPPQSSGGSRGPCAFTVLPLLLLPAAVVKGLRKAKGA